MNAFVVKTSNKPVRVTLEMRGDVLHYTFCWKDKRYRASTDTGIEREAREIARKAVEKVTSERGAVAMPVADAVAEYLAARWSLESEHANNRSYQDAKSRLGLFASFADIDIGTTSEDEILMQTQRFLARRKNGRSAVNDRAVLSRFYGHLIMEGRVSWRHNPALSPALKLAPLSSSDPTPAGDKELAAFLPVAKESAVWPVVVLCLGCGLRPAEATRTQWADVDLKNRTVRVVNYKGKRRRARVVSMNEWVSIELALWRMANKGDSLFPYNRFTSFDMVAALKPSISLQTLRQTACTRAVESGMDLKDYVQQFGHSLATSEKHYLLWSRKGERVTAMEALNFQNLSKSATKSATAFL